ncbi:hypothetical protein V6Z12_D08G022500 [Gossypium hirsutum]
MSPKKNVLRHQKNIFVQKASLDLIIRERI